MAETRLLITGMSGLIGGIMRRALHDKYELVALNRREVPGVRCYRADIADLDAIRPAFEDVEDVLHLAAVASGAAGFDDVLHHNVIGTYNVFEAARDAGVKRVVFASSGAVISRHELDQPYADLGSGPDSPLPDEWPMLTDQSPLRPHGLYGCSKVWGEALARHCCDQYGMSFICVRIGAVTPDDRPTDPRQYSCWCSHRDVAQMLERCIAAPGQVQYDVFYAVSNNHRNYRDLAHAREVLGYEPQDSADDFVS